MNGKNISINNNMKKSNMQKKTLQIRLKWFIFYSHFFFYTAEISVREMDNLQLVFVLVCDRLVSSANKNIIHVNNE